MLRLFIGVLFGLFLVSCAHTQPESLDQETPGAESPTEETLVPRLPAPQSSRAADLNDEETDMGLLPETYNKKVNKWVEYFQSRGRKDMKRYLSRSSRYLPKMKKILKEEGLPEDLVYIALIESGFRSSAHSSASAVGYWQFIRGTARRYGLKQNYHVDERRDFILSTKAAARYLKALYNLFGSWYLAIASYNVGENRIKNLVMRHYTRDFWQLARDKRLPRETQNYVPKFLAARMIAKHPEKYGFDDVVYEPPLDFKEVAFAKGIRMKAFAKHMGVTYREIQRLNPAYLRGVIPSRKGGAVVRVPSQMDDKQILAALQKSKSSEKMRMVVSGQHKSYRIRRGDTLSHIAQRFGTSIRALRSANGFRRRALLYPGKKIKIPTGRFVGSAKAVAAKVSGSEKSYRVRPGDSLYSIARKFGTSVVALKKRNGIGRKSLIQEGKVLVIPGKGGKVTSRYHVVKRGDTLIAIANRYKIKMSQLMAMNKLGRAKTLSIGKKLKIKP